MMFFKSFCNVSDIFWKISAVVGKSPSYNRYIYLITKVHDETYFLIAEIFFYSYLRVLLRTDLNEEENTSAVNWPMFHLSFVLDFLMLARLEKHREMNLQARRDEH